VGALANYVVGGGDVERKKVLKGEYKLVIAAKEPWRLGTKSSKYAP
jgi:hypothetical protein